MATNEFGELSSNSFVHDAASIGLLQWGTVCEKRPNLILSCVKIFVELPACDCKFCLD
jgi:hypothetical protein